MRPSSEAAGQRAAARPLCRVIRMDSSTFQHGNLKLLRSAEAIFYYSIKQKRYCASCAPEYNPRR